MSAPPIRILIIEDQYFARLALQTLLDAREDMRIVAEAGVGSQALPLYQEHKPDITIMDLRLPGTDGFAAIRAIRAADPEARIVVLSNYDGSEDVYRAVDAGAMAYLTKDINGDDLIGAIKTVHSGRRYLPPGLASLLATRVAADALTARELEVLELLAQGFSNKEIADRLGIADKTARVHVSRILEKLNVADRTQAVISALQRGIVHFG